MQKPAHPAFFLRIAIPSPLRRLFDYLPLPDQPLPVPGSRISVPFGRRQLTGILVAVSSDSDIDPGKLKSIIAVLDDEPLFDEAVLQLYLWASDYYMFPVGMAMQTSVPAAIRAGGDLRLSGLKVWQLTAAGLQTQSQSLARAPQQQKVLDLLRSYKTLSTAELTAALGKPAGAPLKALQEKGLVLQKELQTAAQSPRINTEPLKLNGEQSAALDALSEASAGFGCFLLEGITGSGKTEIYLQLIASILEQGRQVLVLVPEISLTPQTISRFRERFDCNIVAFHSGLTDRQRRDGWLQARAGRADIVIGTRSAIFTPMPRCGLIIIDEEHDDSYKQQEGFRYSARDLAVFRARQLDIPVLLGSATPSLESLHNALSGRYRHLHLSQRAGVANTPELHLVDMKLQQTEEGLSLTLRQQLAEHLGRNQQALIFLNRRGFAPLLQCQDCGWIAECPRCERSYTLHQQPAALRCHHCEASKTIPGRCPSCAGSCLGGIGQGTERIEQYLQETFPDFPVIRIDRDTTRASGSLQDLMDRVQSGEPAILLGTQMLAKGHHFPRVTLVAVLDADSGLFSADFRGQENLGQLLTQVAGRAGRSDAPGQVLIQSYHTTHPGLQLLIGSGYGAFARQLLEERRQGQLPPFSRFVMLRAEASRRELPEKFLTLARQLSDQADSRHLFCYGPMPSPIGKKAGHFRAQLIIQGHSRQRLQTHLHQLIAQLEQHALAKKVRWNVDVDPLDFS